MLGWQNISKGYRKRCVLQSGEWRLRQQIGRRRLEDGRDYRSNRSDRAKVDAVSVRFIRHLADGSRKNRSHAGRTEDRAESEVTAGVLTETCTPSGNSIEHRIGLQGHAIFYFPGRLFLLGVYHCSKTFTHFTILLLVLVCF